MFKQVNFKLNTLRKWYVDEMEWYGKYYEVAFGAFFNRPGIYDFTIGHTSPVKEISIDYVEKEYLIQTENTLYHCAFESCFFEKQDNSKIVLSDYEKIKAEYFKPIDTSGLAKDDMLLVLSDLQEFYFETIFFYDSNGARRDYISYPHLGMYSDTYLVEDRLTHKEVDIRWYVKQGLIEFYSYQNGGRNMYVENRGDFDLDLFVKGVRISMAPGERKKLQWPKPKREWTVEDFFRELKEEQRRPQ